MKAKEHFGMFSEKEVEMKLRNFMIPILFMVLSSLAVAPVPEWLSSLCSSLSVIMIMGGFSFIE
ncbi:hypothetical protein ACQZV8_10980 [Magnetococcales bacterium HHB-1]